MNLLAPLARPVFSWNHDELMREGAQSLARRLGVELAVPDTSSQRHRPARAARSVVLGAVLAAVAVLGWRRRTSPR
jgi:hypothetical protein